MYQHLRSSLRRFGKSFVRSYKKRRKTNRAWLGRELYTLEKLEVRAVLTGSNPTLTALDAANAAVVDGGTITVKAGSPLWVPLDGADVDGGALSYTVTSSNTGVLNASLASSSDKWARINVSGFGSMLFHLFDSQVPRVTGHFEQLAAPNGYYNAAVGSDANIKHPDLFHRVISGFVIQGGDRSWGPTNTPGTGGSSLGNFDDQFNLDLQHNRTGVLSYAKGADDTNDSQWFITDGPTRSLDFNHSVFGVLVEGESVRAAIDAVATNPATDRPLSDVVISSIDILDDNQDQVMMLKALPGVTTGTSQITVRVADAEGNFITKVFNVNVVADDSNGSPFLNDIPAQSGVAGTAKSVQLSTQDAEGDPVSFNQPTIVNNVTGATATVSSTGLLNVTPPANFAGQIQVKVGVKQTTPTPNTVDSTGDSQVVSFNFAPAAPTGISLLSGSDTGASNSDRITNAATLQFLVSGVIDNAQVQLFDGTTQLGTATAVGGQASFTVDTSTVTFAQGVHVLTAKQVVSGVSSTASTGLSITYDTSVADFTTPPPSTAEGNVPFVYDVQNPEETAQGGLRYELVDAPEGMTINTTTGVINWKPLPTQVGAHTFKIRATDLAGNQRDQSATINISVVRLAQFSVSITDLSGNPLTSIEKGQEFFLVGRVQDLRGDATGVSAAFFDVAFDSQFASVQGSIEHLNGFTDNASGAAGGTGLDEVGGSTTATNLAGQLVNIFRVKMKAEKTGQADFSADIAESHSSTARTATSSGSTTSLDASNLLFTGATLSVVPNFKIFDQTANVDEDTANREIDVLGNATKPSGETLTIDSVGPRDHGGSVQIVNNKLVYTPAANFFGEETFTYTVKNSTGDALTATVRVQVANVNDPPTAANDSITVAEDSGVTTIDVLANDSFAPDPQETLTIKSVSAGSKGGTIQIDATSNVIRYKPAANANGTETFTYTISDGHGGEATATVTVTITPVNDNPTAVNDTQRVPQNSTDNVINVLANDGGAPDVGETITIVSKTDPAHGTLKLQGGQLLYTPTAGFRGVDTFTYTISDGNGGTATATATIEVANSNSPPIGNDDKASTKRNTSVDIDVLGNDSVNGDTGEALTVSAVTQPTTGGKVSILANGKIRFEPTVGFVGKTTFTYTVSDPLKATDTATVEVEVLGIAPSELAGFVFMDLNNNGVKDSNEPGLAGVTVKLDGKNTDNASVSKTATTDLTGRYVFSDVLTGTYTITETQPAFLIDGQSLGGQHGTVKTTNVLNVNLSAENTKANDLNFTELGRQPTAFKLYELFGSTARNSILASGVSGQSASWLQSAGSQWSSYQKLDVKLSADGKTATIEATNAAGVRQRATAPVGPSQLVRVISTDGGNTLVRLFGGPDKFNLQSVANVAPSFTKGDNRTVLEDAAKTTVSNWATNIKAGGADDAGQTVTFTVTSDKPELFEELPAIDSSGTLTFKPKANANGVATLRVVAKDNGGTLSGGTDTSPEQTFTITITAVNDAPSFTKGANQTVAEDAGAQTVNSWATNISKGPADEASQTVTFDVTSNNPNLFEVAPAIDANGKLTYTPKANASGVATVTVRLKDSGGTASGGKDTSDDQTFTITVTSTNDPPVAVADSATTNEGSPVTINVLSNDTEPDGDPLTVTILTPPSSSQGTAAVNADKTITFTPATNFAGQATFTYQISDGKGGVATGNVTVTVNEINDAPSFTKGANQTVAEDAGAQTVTNWATNISAGPSSESAQTLTFQVTNNNADLFEVAPAIDATGKLTYTPKANANGTATVTVVLKDNGGTANGGVDTSAAQTFTITVTAVNDTPTITPPSGSLTTAPDTNFEFSQANDTAIAVDDDAEAASQIEVDLSIGAAVGTLSLGSTTGITISTGGNGADQTHIVFRGTLANVATALDGLVYKPATGFTGDATISLTVDDLGNTGSGGPKTAQTDLTITVGSQSSQLSADSVDNFMSQM